MSTPAAIGAEAAIAWFAAFLLLDAIAQRLYGGGARYLLRAYTVTGIAFIATVLIALPGGTPALARLLALLFGAAINASLFVLYMPFAYTVRTSLSVQSLVLLRRRGGRLTEAELYRRFAGEEIIARRLATLAQSGYLERDDGRYRLSARGRCVARSFAAVKRLWRLGPGG